MSYHRLVDEYRGYKLYLMNVTNSSKHYGIHVDGQFSALALISIQACKNVIDTYLRNKKLASYCQD